ncbi:MAG: hypothetical protein ACE5HD_11285 [Acidobacteriota bacterium]
MGEKEPRASSPLLGSHMQAFRRLPYGTLLFRCTAAMDLKLVERGRTDLADELALMEERLGRTARSLGKEAAAPGGLGRVLDAAPEARELFETLLARILPVLGDPTPRDLLGGVKVSADLHATPSRLAPLPLFKRGELDPGRN